MTLVCDADALVAQVQALAGSGASRVDPVRFRYLEALARRIGNQAPEVQTLLARKLADALAAYEALTASEPRSPRHRATPPSRRTALASLNDSLRRDGTEAADSRELPSARRFRESWTRERALARADQAQSRRPANAGPLNSHVLVLQALELMRDISPAYLARFSAYVESLAWLEAADVQAAVPLEAKKPRGARASRARGG